MQWWATSQLLIRCLNALCPFVCLVLLWFFLGQTLLQQNHSDGSLHSTAAAVSVPETVIPQCFAKAGKMEPNHLLNGFGPLQPAVAMLWWLQEPPTQSLQWQEAISWWWLAYGNNNIWCVWWLSCSMLKLSHFLTNKEISPSFKTLVWSTFLTECYLSASNRIDILTALSMTASKIAGGG